MEPRSDLLEHARTALERSTRSLSDMRVRLRATAPMGRPHHLLLEGVIQDLSRRHDALAQLYDAMSAAPTGELHALWQQFFAGYDTYLEALRSARSQLALDACAAPRGRTTASAVSRPPDEEHKP